MLVHRVRLGSRFRTCHPHAPKERSAYSLRDFFASKGSGFGIPCVPSLSYGDFLLQPTDIQAIVSQQCYLGAWTLSRLLPGASHAEMMSMFQAPKSDQAGRPRVTDLPWGERLDHTNSLVRYSSECGSPRFPED